MQNPLLAIKFLHSDLTQNKAYPQHSPYLSSRHTHVPMHITSVEGRTTDLLVPERSPELDAVICPVNGSSKATRFHLMIFIIFKMYIIHRATVHKSINFHSLF